MDLFGNETFKKKILSDEFLEPPFSILDSKKGLWQARKRKWISLGIKSEIGRKENLIGLGNCNNYDYDYDYSFKNDTSIFDPYLCEILYKWFCPEIGEIIDPFAGGSVRGIVANKLGFKYTGIDIRQEQIDSNRDQAIDFLEANNQPQWYVGDSNEVLNGFVKQFDFVFSCPPYADLEVYSDLKNDISNMPYIDFLIAYKSIIKKSCNLLKSGGYACFVVSEVRDKKGFYIGFVPDTIKAFEEAGMKFYNEIILLNSINTASMRARKYMNNKKVARIHQNILVFVKP
jgi:DNA modification methylase